MFENETDELDFDDIDLDELTADIQEPPENAYIADDSKAVELLARLIQFKRNQAAIALNEINQYIDGIFSLFSEVTIKDELQLYRRFKNAAAKLSEQQKVQQLQYKAVVSLGGQFSAGKSAFINSISGIQQSLPVAQAPTTSIPTYILKSNRDTLRAHSIYGYSVSLSPEAMNAMTHEFYESYKIGFSAFIDCIIAESSSYKLKDYIALLDTPGYSKYDAKTESRMSVSDREKARLQLRISDYLIWLVDIDNGCITEEDLRFIESLHIKNSVLIVFTKADKKSEGEIKKIIENAIDTIKKTAIKCYGITAYSSIENREYGNNLISLYFNDYITSRQGSTDVYHEFLAIENELKKNINSAIESSKVTAVTLFRYIRHSEIIHAIKSISALWGETNQKKSYLKDRLDEYLLIEKALNEALKKYLKRDEQNERNKTVPRHTGKNNGRRRTLASEEQ